MTKGQWDTFFELMGTVVELTSKSAMSRQDKMDLVMNEARRRSADDVLQELVSWFDPDLD